jgi:hypothetical protein
MIKTIVRVVGFLVAAVMTTAIGGFSYLYFHRPAMAPPADVKVEIFLGAPCATDLTSGFVRASTLFSNPESSCESVIPGPFEIRTRFVKLTSLSPLSTAPILICEQDAGE